MKTTPWFNGSQKPVRVGLYQTEDFCGIGWSWWNGDLWGVRSFTRRLAYESRHMISSFQDDRRWRGLAHKGKD